MNTLRELHSQIDKEYDDESVVLEEEYNRRKTALAEARDRDHVALDRRWTKITGDIGTNGKDAGSDDDWPAFLANDVIQSLIESCNPQDKINVNCPARH